MDTVRPRYHPAPTPVPIQGEAPTPPKTLYRYRSFVNPDHRRSELEALIRDACCAVASKPIYFNDPHDCNMVFEAASQEELRHFLNSTLPKVVDEGQKACLVNLKEALEAEHDPERARSIQRFRDECFDQLRNSISCACFSMTSTSMPMWYHYANSYKGVCYELEISDVDYTSTLLPIWVSKRERFLRGVQYVEKRPRRQELDLYKLQFPMATQEQHMLDLIRKLTDKPNPESRSSAYHLFDLYMECFFCKSRDWEHEREVRCIRNYVGPSPYSYIEMEPYRLTKIITGPECSEPLLSEIRDFCSAKGIKHCRTSVSSTEYSINILED